MRDRKTEADIKAVRDFIELWGKLHALYNDMTAKEIISADDETKYLETKATIAKRYDELRQTLDFRYIQRGRMTDPVSDVLATDTIRFVSEKNLKKLTADWNDSYILLNSIVERLRSKKRRLEEFNPVGVFLKRFFERQKSGGERTEEKGR